MTILHFHKTRRTIAVISIYLLIVSGMIMPWRARGSHGPYSAAASGSVSAPVSLAGQATDSAVIREAARLTALGERLLDRNQPDSAKRVLDDCRAMLMRNGMTNTYEYLVLMAPMATYFINSQRFDSVAACLETATALTRDIYGTDNKVFIDLSGKLYSYYTILHQPLNCLRVTDNARKAALRTFGPHSDQYLLNQTRYIQWLSELNRTNEALLLAIPLAETIREVYGPTSQQYIECIRDLSLFNERLGNTAEAARLDSIHKSLNGQSQDPAFYFMLAIDAATHHSGDAEKDSVTALGYMARGLALIPDTTDINYLRGKRKLAQVYFHLGDRTTGLGIIRDLARRITEGYADYTESVTAVLNDLMVFGFYTRDIPQAVEAGERLIDILRQSGQPLSSSNIDSMTALWKCYVDKNDREKRKRLTIELIKEMSRFITAGLIDRSGEQGFEFVKRYQDWLLRHFPRMLPVSGSDSRTDQELRQEIFNGILFGKGLLLNGKPSLGCPLRPRLV